MIPTERSVFCNRTLNFRSIHAIGYDMDYTLIHYHVEEWERRTYEYLKDHFSSLGWPVRHLEFDPSLVCRGLIVDLEKGNVLKANRFGFVKKAFHGTAPLDYEVQRATYSRIVIELSDPRFVFLNTLFSLSEGCMYLQLVDLLDRRELPEILGYADLFKRVRKATDATHAAGKLKAEIIANPDRFVDLDPEMPLALLDQKNAGKKLMMITNSEWAYAVPMMNYAFDRFLPAGMSWRELFDVIVIGARKPDFFTTDHPLFEVVTEEGLMKSSQGALKPGTVYFGGSARQIERHLGMSGDQILYIGDHMFGDVRVTKNVLRWRTALILRELEDEIRANEEFRAKERELAKHMDKKEALESRICELKVQIQRKRVAYGPQSSSSIEELEEALVRLRQEVERLDHEIGPLAQESSSLNQPRWGLLMRAGNDKSHLARQVERYADIYTSRVSNLLAATPFVYLRSPRGSLPHDPFPALS